MEFRPSGTLDVLDLLDRGQLDLAIGSFAKQGERFSRRQVMHGLLSSMALNLMVLLTLAPRYGKFEAADGII
jgi:hypothetical protein